MMASPGFLVVANADNPKVVAYDLSTTNSEKPMA
jgi:hypothetical protein